MKSFVFWKSKYVVPMSLLWSITWIMLSKKRSVVCLAFLILQWIHVGCLWSPLLRIHGTLIWLCRHFPQDPHQAHWSIIEESAFFLLLKISTTSVHLQSLAPLPLSITSQRSSHWAGMWFSLARHFNYVMQLAAPLQSPQLTWPSLPSNIAPSTPTLKMAQLILCCLSKSHHLPFLFLF